MKTIILSLTLILFIFPGILTSQTIWQQLNPSPPTNTLNDVFFINENEGLAVGTHGVIVHSENGGVSWKRQYSYASKDLNCVLYSRSFNFGIMPSST